jgi:hypothetical protein
MGSIHPVILGVEASEFTNQITARLSVFHGYGNITEAYVAVFESGSVSTTLSTNPNLKTFMTTNLTNLIDNPVVKYDQHTIQTVVDTAYTAVDATANVDVDTDTKGYDICLLTVGHKEVDGTETHAFTFYQNDRASHQTTVSTLPAFISGNVEINNAFVDTNTPIRGKRRRKGQTIPVVVVPFAQAGDSIEMKMYFLHQNTNGLTNHNILQHILFFDTPDALDIVTGTSVNLKDGASQLSSYTTDFIYSGEFVDAIGTPPNPALAYNAMSEQTVYRLKDNTPTNTHILTLGNVSADLKSVYVTFTRSYYAFDYKLEFYVNGTHVPALDYSDTTQSSKNVLDGPTIYKSLRNGAYGNMNVDFSEGTNSGGSGGGSGNGYFGSPGWTLLSRETYNGNVRTKNEFQNTNLNADNPSASDFSIIPELSKTENINIVTNNDTQKYHMKVMYFSSAAATTADLTYEFKQTLHPFTTNYVGGLGGPATLAPFGAENVSSSTPVQSPTPPYNACMSLSSVTYNTWDLSPDHGNGFFTVGLTGNDWSGFPTGYNGGGVTTSQKAECWIYVPTTTPSTTTLDNDQFELTSANVALQAGDTTNYAYVFGSTGERPLTLYRRLDFLARDDIVVQSIGGGGSNAREGNVTIDGTSYAVSIDPVTDADPTKTPWVLALNYMHQGGTNPALNIRTTSNGFPILPSDGSLDFENVDINGTTVQEGSTHDPGSWGHTGRDLFNKLCIALGSASGNQNGVELRFVGKIKTHSRLLNFKTDWNNMITEFRVGGQAVITTGWPASTYTLLDGHTANLPGTSTKIFFESPTAGREMTYFPFFVDSTSHWAVGESNRWEMDDFNIGYNFNTYHQIWVRANVDGATGLSFPSDATSTVDANIEASVVEIAYTETSMTLPTVPLLNVYDSVRDQIVPASAVNTGYVYVVGTNTNDRANINNPQASNRFNTQTAFVPISDIPTNTMRTDACVRFNDNGTLAFQQYLKLSAPNKWDLNWTEAFTIAFWIKVRSDDNSTPRKVFSLGDAGVTNGVFEVIPSSGGGSITFGGLTFNAVTGITADDTWHHVVMTMDNSASTFTLYVDNSVVTSTSGTFSLSGLAYNAPIRIGKGNDASITDDHMKHTELDDFVVYKGQALDTNQINSMYTQGPEHVYAADNYGETSSGGATEQWILLNRDVIAADKIKTGDIQNVGIAADADDFDASYSLLGDLLNGTGDMTDANLKNSSGAYKFRIVPYLASDTTRLDPNSDNTRYIEWEQTSNPTTNTESVTGLANETHVGLTERTLNGGFVGLSKRSAYAAYTWLAGTGDTSWYYGIGVKTLGSGTFPFGSDDSYGNSHKSELWVVSSTGTTTTEIIDTTAPVVEPYAFWKFDQDGLLSDTSENNHHLRKTGLNIRTSNVIVSHTASLQSEAYDLFVNDPFIVLANVEANVTSNTLDVLEGSLFSSFADIEKYNVFAFDTSNVDESLLTRANVTLFAETHLVSADLPDGHSNAGFLSGTTGNVVYSGSNVPRYGVELLNNKVHLTHAFSNLDSNEVVPVNSASGTTYKSCVYAKDADGRTIGTAAEPAEIVNDVEVPSAKYWRIVFLGEDETSSKKFLSPTNSTPASAFYNYGIKVSGLWIIRDGSVIDSSLPTQPRPSTIVTSEILNVVLNDIATGYYSYGGAYADKDIFSGTEMDKYIRILSLNSTISQTYKNTVLTVDGYYYNHASTVDVEFSSPKTLNEFMWNGHSDRCALPYILKIEYSVDGVNYTTDATYIREASPTNPEHLILTNFSTSSDYMVLQRTNGVSWSNSVSTTFT